jgi:GntR family transcriptional regulator, rspAB operon transcriptional repressor
MSELKTTREGAAAAPSRRDTAYDKILSAIIFGDLAPGSTVDEKSLADDFDLGLASVRDALQRLSLETLVERHPRIGSRIPDLSLRDVQNVFEARVLLEGNCARLAAERANSKDIAVMRAALKDIARTIAARDFRELVARDLRFHRALATATNNQILEKQSSLLLSIGARFWYFALPRMDPDVLRADMAAHVNVIDAIEQRDAGGAEAAMRGVLGRFPDAMKLFLVPFSSMDRAAD